MSELVKDVVLGDELAPWEKEYINDMLKKSKTLREVLSYLRKLGFDVKLQKTIHRGALITPRGRVDLYSYSFKALGKADSKHIIFDCGEFYCYVREYKPRRYYKVRDIERIDLEKQTPDEAISQIEETFRELRIRSRRFRPWFEEYIRYLQEVDREFELYDVSL